MTLISSQNAAAAMEESAVVLALGVTVMQLETPWLAD